jgi:hypothetical protein
VSIIVRSFLNKGTIYDKSIIAFVAVFVKISTGSGPFGSQAPPDRLKMKNYG